MAKAASIRAAKGTTGVSMQPNGAADEVVEIGMVAAAGIIMRAIGGEAIGGSGGVIGGGPVHHSGLLMGMAAGSMVHGLT